MKITQRTRATLEWIPEDEYRWPGHAGADPERSIEDTFGTQIGHCRAKRSNCGMSYRLQDEDPGSADGQRERDWSLTQIAPDGTKRRLEDSTSYGIAYKHATSDHAAQHGSEPIRATEGVAMSNNVQECAYTLERLEEPDSRRECEAIGRCGEHVYQFTRLDDGAFMVTHRVAGGKVEVLNSAVSGNTCYETALQHRRANCCEANR